jgi:dihydroorotate dehydrogenase electron transfer subunit
MSCRRIQAEVLESAPAAADTFRLRLRAPEIAREARPGQFVMLGPIDDGALDPFLPRPFSIHRAGPDGDLELLYALVGRVTREMARLAPGRRVGLLGPQGRGFSATGTGELWLVAGGLGVAPLVFLAEREAPRRKVRLFYGVRSADRAVPLLRLQEAGVAIDLATDDGSAGSPGTVTQRIEAAGPPPAGAVIAACGPWKMLRAIHALAARWETPLELSLETRMACGMGACLGCAIQLAAGRRRVCLDGPVFDGREVFG